MEQPNNILQVQNLSVAFDKTNIIENLSFTLNQRDVLAILGPNGAGKTTLLRALLNIIPYSGTVSWKTKHISYLPPQEFVQRHHLPPLNLEEFFLFKTSDRNKIRQMFYEVGLDEALLSRQFEALSTGQFQRMLIAWALVDDPDVLLFDEPTSGIDVGGEETIYTLLHKFWQQRKLTIIIVTHNLHIVWEHTNHVLCINKQKLCMGTPEEVLTPERLKQLYGTGIRYYEHSHT